MASTHACGYVLVTRSRERERESTDTATENNVSKPTFYKYASVTNAHYPTNKILLVRILWQ